MQDELGTGWRCGKAPLCRGDEEPPRLSHVFSAMWIPARRQENRTITVSLGDFKPQRARVEPECPLQVGNFQVNMSHSYLRVNGEGHCC